MQIVKLIFDEEHLTNSPLSLSAKLKPHVGPFGPTLCHGQPLDQEAIELIYNSFRGSGDKSWGTVVYNLGVISSILKYLCALTDLFPEFVWPFVSFRHPFSGKLFAFRQLQAPFSGKFICPSIAFSSSHPFLENVLALRQL